MLFCIYAGLETELLEKNVGEKGLEHVFTYVPPSELEYPVNFGMNMKDYRAAWDKKYPDGKIEFGFNAVAGYTTGLIIEKTLSVATSLDQLELRRAVFSLSGELKTLDGTFALDEMGGQIGELTPLGQLELDDKSQHQVHLDLSARNRHRQAGLSASMRRLQTDEPDAGGEALMLIYALVAGVLFGLYFSLVGIGLNLVFGVMRIVNLAHGDFLMLGAFVAFGVVTLAGIDPLFAVPLAFVVFVLVGVLLYWVLVPRLQGSVNPEMLSIILFFGLSQVIEADHDDFLRHQRALDPEPALGTVFSTIKVKLFGGKPDGGRADPDLRPGISGALGDRGRHQPDRDRAGLCLSVPHPAGHADPRGDVAARRGAGDRHRCRSRLGGGLRHRAWACGGGRRVRALHVRIGDAGVRRRCDRHLVRHRGAGIARQSLGHRARRRGLRRLLHAGADLSQFMGRSLPYVLLIFILLLRPSGLLGRRVRVA